jgi:hypothetical protein
MISIYYSRGKIKKNDRVKVISAPLNDSRLNTHLASQQRAVLSAEL